MTPDFSGLIDDAKRRGFVHYRQLAALRSDDLDEVLHQLDRFAVEIVADPSPTSHSDSDEPADEPLQVYLREVAKVPRLTPEDELQLMAAGGGQPQRQLVEANLFRVVAIARHYRRPGFHLLDLIQQGNEGLLQAAGTFQPAHGYNFPIYAAFCIHRSLHGLITNPPEKVVPVHLR